MPIHPYFSMTGDEARGLLFGLLEADKIQLMKDPSMPSMREMISDGRIRYDQYDPKEHWQTYRELVEQVREKGVGYGDCEDLATAVAAEDQIRSGIQSRPFAYTPREGLFHVVTAVPEGSYGSILVGSDWPPARGAPPIEGYVFQDPSAAAGMGSHLIAPGSPSAVAGLSPSFGYGIRGTGGAVGIRFGADGRLMDDRVVDRRTVDRRASGRGLGGVFRSFRQGLLGGTSTQDVARQLGEGARSASGLSDGWAKSLGEGLPSALGIGGKKASPSGGSGHPGARRSEGRDQETEEDQEEGGEDEFGSELLDDLDDLYGEDEFGLDDSDDLDDLYGEDEFGLDDSDDLFGLEDEDEDEFGLSLPPDDGLVTGSYSWWLESAGNEVADSMSGDDRFGSWVPEDDPAFHEDFGALARLSSLSDSSRDGGFSLGSSEEWDEDDD